MEQEQIEKNEDRKGMYCICPKCHKKCYYSYYGFESWACECVECNELLDED